MTNLPILLYLHDSGSAFLWSRNPFKMNSLRDWYSWYCSACLWRFCSHTPFVYSHYFFLSILITYGSKLWFRHHWFAVLILFCQTLCYLRFSHWAVWESIWHMVRGPLAPLCSETDSHGSSLGALESRGGWYSIYIITPQYYFEMITVSCKFLHSGIIGIMIISQFT